MKLVFNVLALIVAGLVLPKLSYCQTVGTSVQKMHDVLENLYNEMIPLCSRLILVTRGIGGFGATFYIGVRVWTHIANTEAIDFFPLFRPFVISLLIAIFPDVLGLINGLLKPTVLTTQQMVTDSNASVRALLDDRAKAITQSEDWKALGGDPRADDKDWYKYEHPDDEQKQDGVGIGIGSIFSFNILQNAIGFFIKLLLSLILQVLYYAASLCIDAMRTFHLIILSILGPFVFCLSIYDGFQHTLPVWLARYINIYLWLPIANLFGAMINRIQEGMLRLDLSQMQQGLESTFSQTDIAYMIFLLIAVIGYFSIPSIANYIVHASGGSSILNRVNSMVVSGGKWVSGGSSFSGTSAGSMSKDIYGDDKKMESFADAKNSEPYLKDFNNYQRDKLSD